MCIYAPICFNMSLRYVFQQWLTMARGKHRSLSSVSMCCVSFWWQRRGWVNEWWANELVWLFVGRFVWRGFMFHFQSSETRFVSFFAMCACLYDLYTLMLLPDPTGPLAAGVVACLPREGRHGQQWLCRFLANATVAMMGDDSSLSHVRHLSDRPLNPDGLHTIFTARHVECSETCWVSVLWRVGL
jgi:hypothetical protein